MLGFVALLQLQDPKAHTETLSQITGFCQMCLEGRLDTVQDSADEFEGVGSGRSAEDAGTGRLGEKDSRADGCSGAAEEVLLKVVLHLLHQVYLGAMCSGACVLACACLAWRR